MTNDEPADDETEQPAEPEREPLPPGVLLRIRLRPDDDEPKNDG